MSGGAESPVSYQTIIFEVSGAVARLTLNRPERLNSFNAQMHAEVRAALAAVQPAAARVLVVTGAGRGFCAGQDLNDRAVAPGAAPPDLAESIEQHYKPLVLALRALPLPVIAAVNGVAAGAGANIALACDLVVAARSATFVQAFAKLGLVPDSGGTWLLPRLVGTARALGLALLGDKLPAEQAAAWGLIWRCVEDGELAAVVAALAQQFAAAPTRGLARTKQAIYEGWAAHWRSSSTSSVIFRASSAAAPTTRKGWPPSPRSARRASPADLSAASARATARRERLHERCRGPAPCRRPSARRGRCSPAIALRSRSACASRRCGRAGRGSPCACGRT